MKRKSTNKVVRRRRRVAPTKRKIIEFASIPEPTDGNFIISDHHFLPRHPSDVKRLWIVIDPEYTADKQPTHQVNCFLEDRMHDWDYWKPPGMYDVCGIRYYGMARGQKNVRFLVEFN